MLKLKPRNCSESCDIGTGEALKNMIVVHREEKYFVAIDLITKVADQGATEEEAIARLKRGLEKHYLVRNEFLSSVK
jgi:hypothetical protein